MASLSFAYNICGPILQKFPVLFTCPGCIIAAFLLIYISKFFHVNLSFLLLQSYDNVQASYRRGGKNVSWQERTVARAYAAHENSWEAFTGFSVAMILAKLTVGWTNEIEQLANAFLFVRAIYIVTYILAFNVPLSAIRSGVFFLGMAVITKIFSLSVGDVLLKK